MQFITPLKFNCLQLKISLISHLEFLSNHRPSCHLEWLGGLSLHLNYLIASCTGISFRQFGTLPIGIFLSNLDSRHLMTSPRTLFGQFWHMSIFGDSRAIWVICQKKMPSENQFFLDEGAMGLQSVSGFVGGQIPRLYGGTIFGGVCDTLRGSSRAYNAKCPFFHTFVTA